MDISEFSAHVRSCKHRSTTEDNLGLRVLYEHPLGGKRANNTSIVEYDCEHYPSRFSMTVLMITLSIVAIHGIGAHPDDTWCKKVNEGRPGEHYVNWLKDPRMLPAIAPTARIMRYGYESQWFGEDPIRQKAAVVAHRLLLSLRRARKVQPSSSAVKIYRADGCTDLPTSSFDIHSALLRGSGCAEGKSQGLR